MPNKQSKCYVHACCWGNINTAQHERQACMYKMSFIICIIIIIIAILVPSPHQQPMPPYSLRTYKQQKTRGRHEVSPDDRLHFKLFIAFMHIYINCRQFSLQFSVTYTTKLQNSAFSFPFNWNSLLSNHQIWQQLLQSAVVTGTAMKQSPANATLPPDGGVLILNMQMLCFTLTSRWHSRQEAGTKR